VAEVEPSVGAGRKAENGLHRRIVGRWKAARTAAYIIE
jgi:hypothetical protein